MTPFERRTAIALAAPEYHFKQYADGGLCVYPKGDEELFCEFENGQPTYKIITHGLTELPIDPDRLKSLVHFCTLLAGGDPE